MAKVLSGRSDSNIDFNELRGLLLRLDFVERVRGSHHVLVRPDLDILLNLQREGHLAKPYQVRQIRHAITTHQLLRDEEEE